MIEVWQWKLVENLMKRDDGTEQPMNGPNAGGISVNTPVALGLIVALSMGLAGAIWWAGNWTGSVQSKIDLILTSVSGIAASDKTQNEDIVSMKIELETLKKLGSTPMQKLIDQISDISRKLELHMEAERIKNGGNGKAAP